MMTVRQIVEAVGHRTFAEALGVVPSAVSNMKAADLIPAKKHKIVVHICAQHDLPAPPDSLFSFDPIPVDPNPAPLRAAS
jgi:hypothetical protein